jgi:DNA modification methylase
MDENKRILKDEGTCWVNLGDTYSTQSGGMRDLAEGNTTQYGQVDYGKFEGSQNVRQPKSNFRDKTRVGIPERFYINCIDNDWIARNHIVWAKANAMPTSVKDRFQNKWESIFFFAKNTQYYFNLDAVREVPLGGYAAFNRRIRDAKKLNQMGLDGAIPAAKASAKEMEEYGNHQPGDRSHFGTGKDIGKNMEKAGNTEQGKNPGDIFWINPKPFKEAHFATFPEELPEWIIKCACPQGGTVFDPFMGSGTVAAVALKNNRKWLGIEINPEYVKIIKKRLDSLQSDTMEQFFE